MDVLPEQDPRPSHATGPRLPLEPLGSGALAPRRICPYLTSDTGPWRSAHPAKEHRCGAVTPAALLAADKQRRLCLADAHRFCATFVAARRYAIGDEVSPVVAGARAAGRNGSGPRHAAEDGSTVTRWSLVRTAPVVLDHRRVPGVRLGVLGRAPRSPQLMLGGLMALAFVAIAFTRLPGSGTPAAAGDTPSPSLTAPAPSVGPTPRSTPRPTPVASVSASPSAVPSAPTASTAVRPSSPPATRSYTVRSGDTLYGIAIRFGTTVRAIQESNGMGNSTELTIGRVLKVP